MKRGVVLALLLLAALAWIYQAHLKQSPGGLAAYGTLEARNIEVGSEVGGRVIALGTHEGEQVTAGQLLVTLDDEQLAPAVALADAELAAARAELAKREHGSRSEDIAEARAAATDQSSGFRVDEIAQARAERAGLEADASNAERRVARSMSAQQSHDDAQTAAVAAHAAVRAAGHGPRGQRLPQ